MPKRNRLSVPLSQPLYDQIKIEAEALGVTMSSWVAFKIGEQLRIQIEFKNQLQERIGDQFGDLIKKNSDSGDGR